MLYLDSGGEKTSAYLNNKNIYSALLGWVNEAISQDWASMSICWAKLLSDTCWQGEVSAVVGSIGIHADFAVEKFRKYYIWAVITKKLHSDAYTLIHNC